MLICVHAHMNALFLPELLGKNKDKSVFEHPAYPIPVCAVGAEYDWVCGSKSTYLISMQLYLS